MAVYLDHNATTPLHEAVYEGMQPWMRSMTGNPSSLHRFGRMQRDAIERAREQVAALVDARPEQVIFTSGGTESNNLLIKGLIAATHAKRIAVSAIEHMSLIEPAAHLANGCVVDSIPVNGAAGYISTDALEQSLKPDTALVSVMAANNETGVIQDVTKLAACGKQGGAWFHTDASQAAGKIAVSYRQWGVDAMTLSAHKFYGPLGVGALIIDGRLPLHALQHGGSQEHGLRAGTENVPAIVGFGIAAQLALQELAHRADHVMALRAQLEAQLVQMPGVTIFAQQSNRLPNTVQFGVAGFDGETLLMQLDRAGFAVSSGSACTSGKTEPSHVLSAMGVADDIALAAVRVSFGKDNNVADVDGFAQALSGIVDSMSNSAVMMAATI
jgi:cysteine desulfurase